MIVEDLQSEIDEEVNRLVIEEVAGLLSSCDVWITDFLEYREKFELPAFDNNNNLIVAYIRILSVYVKDKLKLRKAERYDSPRLDQLQRNFYLSNHNKLALRERLKELGIDYKIYHKQDICHHYY